jgi:hypothetical protein
LKKGTGAAEKLRLFNRKCMHSIRMIIAPTDLGIWLYRKTELRYRIFNIARIGKPIHRHRMTNFSFLLSVAAAKKPVANRNSRTVYKCSSGRLLIFLAASDAARILNRAEVTR